MGHDLCVRELPTTLARWPRRAMPVLMLAAAACDAGLPPWCVVPEGAALRAATAPSGWSEPPALDIAWRIDGSAPGRELELPVSVAVSGDRIAIADFGLREVVVVGLDGEWIGRRGRHGQGPGELMAPFAAAWRSDGLLLVYDPLRSRLVEFDGTGTGSDGAPTDRSFMSAVGGGARWIRLDASGTLLAHPHARSAAPATEIEQVVIRGGVEGMPVDTLVRTTVAAMSVPGIATMPVAGALAPVADMRGDVLVLGGDRPEYILRVYNADGLSHVICRDVEPLPFDRAESEDTEDNVPADVLRAMADAAVPDPLAPFGRVLIDADGRLWVQRDRPRALWGLDGVIGRPGALLDVFNADGAYLGEVRMPERVRFVGAAGDLIIGLESSELDELSIVAYRPDW